MAKRYIAWKLRRIAQRLDPLPSMQEVLGITWAYNSTAQPELAYVPASDDSQDDDDG